MCTVVFIPNDGRLYISSLRDEHPNRAKALLPKLINPAESGFIAPIDPQGGGTWLGINRFGNAIVLLNGGFVNHKKRENYKRSRGLIVTELLSQPQPIASWDSLDLVNIEPFTLIVWSNKKLYHLVWDGNNKHKLEVDASKAQIWSSSTLYDEEVKHERQTIFQNWLDSKPEINSTSVLNFFKNASVDEEAIFIINSTDIKTHSHTFIEIENDIAQTISYQDLFTGNSASYSIPN